MAETIQLEIVTPERLVVSEAAEYIEIPGETGYLGILPGHAPLISELAPGELTYRMATRQSGWRWPGDLRKSCKPKSRSWQRPRKKQKR